MKYALLLNKIRKEHYRNVGGKSINLARLCQKDFCVPQGFCLNIEAYKRFIGENNLNATIEELLTSSELNEYKRIEQRAKKIRNLIKHSEIPQEIIEEIKKARTLLDCERFVIRSSAIAEDLEDASFAGQYDSYLNLRELEEILYHIKKCYASLWTTRAISYRIKNNIPPKDIAIAILVQEMVPSQVSGVLFTVNPISGNKSEMLIESNFGLGESIMSGKTTPDQFIVKWNENKSSSIEILNKQIGKKDCIIEPNTENGKYGTKEVSISVKKAKQPSLSKAQLKKLVQIGKRIEEAFEAPQDIEWAIDKDDKLHILQTRPITNLGKEYKDDRGDEWYTRGYSDDYWNDPVSPLFFDLLGNQLTKVVNIELNSIMGYKRMEAKLLKLHKGHVYFNLEVLKRKVEYEIPKFLRNENILNYFPKGEGTYGKKTVKHLDFHLIDRIVAELRIMLFDPHGSITKTDKAYYEWTEEEFVPLCEEFDQRLSKLSRKDVLRGLFELAEKLDEKMTDHFQLVRYGIPVHNIGMNLVSEYLLNKFIGKKEALKYFPILISGLENKLTQTNEQIYNLTFQIQQSSKLKSIILNTDSEKILSRLNESKDPGINQFFNSFQEFLEEYGHRGFTREPYYPRWQDEPKYVFDILKSLLEEKDDNWESKKKKKKIKKKITERKVEQKIRSQFLGIFKWKIFSIILNFSRRYICFRENQRYNLDIWITKNRNVYLEIGKIFKSKGVIDEDHDIFFLHRKEIKKIIEIGVQKIQIKKIKSKIQERKTSFLEYEHETPPKFLIGNREYNDIKSTNKEDNVFRGIPASQGIKSGTIRILKDIADIPTVKSDEILVVPRTDPGWTPVFSKIGGLITETGGVLSHGAVVSREYDIPAVTNIPDATSLLKTGQKVEVNGFNGEVKILSK